jgi:hypothetical protein
VSTTRDRRCTSPAPVCGVAHRVAEHDPAVAGHRWLARATDYCQQDKSADAAAQLERLGFSPEPDRPLRALLSAEVVADDLGRLAAEQREDGGWDVHFKVFSPAAALDWRGDATVRALKILEAHGRLEAGAGGHGRQSRSR